jgi:hypothetical protein
LEAKAVVVLSCNRRCSSHHRLSEGLLLLHHGIAEREYLSHTGCDGHFFSLPPFNNCWIVLESSGWIFFPYSAEILGILRVLGKFLFSVMSFPSRWTEWLSIRG